MSQEAEIRITQCNQREFNPNGRVVLYWMTAFRRLRSNFALDRAVELSNEFEKPLVIIETLPCDEPWASIRQHSFIIDGMRDNLLEAEGTPCTYLPCVESKPDTTLSLLESLMPNACWLVTDDFPSRFHQRQIDAVSRLAQVPVEKIDSNGILPLKAAEQVYRRAFSFRRFIQSVLPEYFSSDPAANPLKRLLPATPFDLSSILEKRWVHGCDLNSVGRDTLRNLPIDYAVPPTPLRGGTTQATILLSEFLESRLPDYSETRNHPDRRSTSGLAPYLHHGHISTHEIFWKLMEKEGWNPANVASGHSRGQRSGWWGVSESAEAFLDQLITWRELGFNMAWQCEDYDQYQSLPDWARTTLEEHSTDLREHLYDLRQLENGETHDRLWNAAQIQLAQEATIHNYLRMLWGKKILEWTRSPEEALAIMIELNNKYALDGRDPNSYSGIFWILGRYDRPWGPERRIFGKIRYMSSENTGKKVRVKNYLKQYGG